MSQAKQDDPGQPAPEASVPRRVRTLFISDLHLGMRGTRTGELVQFLRAHDAETLYLVGDILDGWRLAKNWHWPLIYNEVLEILLEKARQGARIVYLPGNHDEFLREYLGTKFGQVELTDDIIHTTVDGRRFLVIHGDQFDVVVRHAKWLAHVGDWAYRLTMRTNGIINWVRRRIGKEYWSLSAWAKQKVKGAVNVIGEFEEALTHEAKEREVDGVICGHIHKADMHDQLGVTYVNTGDWVESCTAVVEDFDGQLELIKWAPAAAPKKPKNRKRRASN